MKVRILDEAQTDLVEGYRFYEVQSEGLGDYFLDCLFADIDSLRLHAGIHAVHWGYHRLLARRFPFAVYYRVHGTTADVYAVLDCRRDPRWIWDRLSQPHEYRSGTV